MSQSAHIMEDTNAPYRAVYHFCDDALVDAFFTRIPRTQLLDFARRSETLRSRNFPGFRITNRFPTDRQLITAYRREVVDRRNSGLASSLCTCWIAQQPSLAGAALKSLGIESTTPADANSWIEEVHKKLASAPDEELLTTLVHSLAGKFPNDDIHIFVSLISYGEDQQTVRDLVEREILGGKSGIAAQKVRLESDLRIANSAIEGLTKQDEELKVQLQDQTRNAQDLIKGLQSELDLIVNRLDLDKSPILALSSQIEELHAQLLQLQRAQDESEKQRHKVSKNIAQQRHLLQAMEVDLNKQIAATTEAIDEKVNYVNELTKNLEVIKSQLESQHSELDAASPISISAGADSEETTSAPEAANRAQPYLLATEGLDTNTICYKGIQRIFRNSVVIFLRERLTRLFPDDHVQRLKKTFGEEWDKAAQNAARSRESLGTATMIRDEYDLLGTNHFYNIFERHYDRIFTPEAGQPLDVPKPVKPRFLGNLKAIKDARDPLSHPVEEEISFEEAQHLLYIAQEILKWLGCAVQASEISSLATSLAGHHEAGMPRLLRRLPSEDSIYIGWIGRDRLLKDLAECFANPDGKRCLLAGDGGKGKSAAAYRFVQGMASGGGRYQLIIWLSAKKRRFREGLPANIESPDFVTAGEAIDRLLTEYGATIQDMTGSLSERKRLLFEFLNEFPAFIVADDIDTVLDDEDVVSLFTHEIPHTRSSVLVTSRRSIPGIRSFIVPGFDAIEAEEFVKSRIQLYGLNPQEFSKSLIKDIAQATDGLPLYMDDLMRLTKVVDIHKAIKMWTEKGGDEARKYALQREVEMLSPSAKNCLIAAAVTDDPISFAELESILGLSEERIVSALTELQTLFLFPKAPAVEGEQRYQINLNTKKLVRLVEGSNDAYARIEHKSKALAGNLPDAGRGLVSSLIRQALLRFNAQQYIEAEVILSGAIEKYPNAPDLHGVLGFIYKRVGRVVDARTQFETAYKLKSKNQETYLHWQKMEISEKEWSKALAVADKALKIVPEAYEIIERRVFTLRQAGFDMHRGLHNEKAFKMWTDAVDEVERSIKNPETLPTGARFLNASMYSSMVVCLDMLKRLEDRNRWLDRWEKEHPDDPQVAIQKEFLVRKRGAFKM
jgi:tetratricopeptide (TPR) repeat protein